MKSVPFSTKDSMESSLKILKENEVNPSKFFERKTNTDGKFLIELKNQNGETIGSSGFYTSEAGMENGILNISKNLTADFQ